MPRETRSSSTPRVTPPAARALGILVLTGFAAGAPVWAGPSRECRDARRDAQPAERLEHRVVQAALGVHAGGVTEHLADELVGREGVPTLMRLLADRSFPRPDNVVAFIAALDDGAATPLLLDALRRPPSGGLSPERDRALLLIPEALGQVASRGDLNALEALLDMTAPGARGRLLVAAARAADAPAATHRALLASALRGLARSNSAAGIDRLNDLALGEAGPLDARAALVREAQAALSLRARLDQAAAAPVEPWAQGFDGTRGSLPGAHLNHVSLTRPMTDYRREAMGEEAASQLRRGSKSCCESLVSEPSQRSFGQAGDGLDVIDDETELQRAGADDPDRVAVVRAINWCGAPRFNVLACRFDEPSGLVVVRLSELEDEARLWIRR